MKYITGLYALNLPCSLATCGDWHTSALRWENVDEAESIGSLWEDYGIEKGVSIPLHEGKFSVANHIRALLDMIFKGDFALAQGMNRDYICNDSYDEEIFEKVYLMKEQENWSEVDRFMHKEYGRKWRLWKNGNSSIAS